MRTAMLSVVATILLGSAARADAFDYLTQALGKLVLVATQKNLESCDYDGAGCFYGFFLDEGANNGITRDFEAGREYVVIGVADDDVEDLDLKLRSEDGGELFLEDTLTDAVPILEFTVNTSGRYQVLIENYDSNGEPSFCALVVLVKGGKGGFDFGEVVESLDNILAAGRIRALAGVSFPRNEMILFGGRFGQGSVQSTYDFALAPGTYVALATGSQRITDIDLSVVEQHRSGDKEGLTISKDDLEDSLPICNFESPGGPHFCFNVNNYASQGPGFIFAMILRSN